MKSSHVTVDEDAFETYSFNKDVPTEKADSDKQADAQKNKQKQEDFTGSWRREYRSPLRTAPWLAKETSGEVVGVSDLLNGEMLSGNPTLRLLNREQTLGAP